MSIKKIFSIFILQFLVWAPFLYAQPQQSGSVEQPKVVKAVEIRGNKNVTKHKIMASLNTLPNKPFYQTNINKDLKTLYSTGFFNDVSVDIESIDDGVKVIYNVKEKPVISDILFEGNTKIQENRLTKKMKTKIEDILNYRVLKEDTEQIRTLYHKKGYTAAHVIYKVDIDNKTNMATIRLIVDEGMVRKIKKIIIEGNKTFSDKHIKKLMQTKSRWLFIRKGYLQEDVLEEDVDRIRLYHQNQGFIDVVVDKEVVLSKDEKSVVVTIFIQENERYLTGSIQLLDNQIFSDLELKNKLTVKEGETFSPGEIQDNATQMQSFYFDKGYIVASVDADTVLNPQTNRVDVTYTIREGQIAYVDKIKVQGNLKTKDFVIRRQLRLAPGDRYDGNKLRRSKERLYNLGYFEDVSFDTVGGSTPTKRDLLVNVKEAKTGELSFGGGYSSIDKMLGFVEVKQKNFDIFNFPDFTGAGQYLYIRGQFGSVRKDIDLSFTEPWMFGKPFSFGFDVFRRSRERSNTSGYSYDETDTGFDVRVGKELGEYLTATGMYQIERVKIQNLPDSASQLLKDEEGVSVTSSIKGILTRDSRDSVFSPTRGNVTTFSTQLAGGPFLGDKDFIKLQADSDWFFTPYKRNVLELRARAGVINNYGDSKRVPIFYRLFTGGADSVRGYKERQIGPRDTGTNDPVGGKSMFVFNAEYTVPVMDFIKGAIFYDAGNVWEEISDFGSDTLRQSVGLGVRVKTPLGPMKLDYGYPVNPRKGDKRSGRFHFNLMRGF